MTEKTLLKILLTMFALGIVMAVLLFAAYVYNVPYYPFEDEPGIYYWDQSNPTTSTLLPPHSHTPIIQNKSSAQSGDPYPPPDATQMPNPYPPPEQPTPEPTLDECPGGKIIFNDEGDAACLYFTPTP